MEWISVKDRLPEDRKMLCVFAQWYPNWNRFINGEVMTYGEITDFREYNLKHEYTHWMPLPEVPNT